jgi:phosphoenolpyruvate carboxykinase (ATP)
VHVNLAAPALVAAAMRRGEGRLSADGALMAMTGVHTGRSVQDKFVVDEPETTDEIWWGRINQKLAPARFEALRAKVTDYLGGQELFVQDLYAGADPAHRVRVRLVTASAWHALFARNMFIRPPAAELADFEPDAVILHAPLLQADPAVDGVRSSTVIALSFARKLILIAGTEYAGEIKKSIFTLMNWKLPAEGVLPMHCSANIGEAGDVALFFGLSGTGKTTLSSDPARRLIGDDEHGWGENGIFNFEGGCYAKVIRLRADAEPEIWAASHRFGTIIENVVIDPITRELDLDSQALTENTRSAYPLTAIPNVVPSSTAGHPNTIVMLTADAFGVLPPIAKLSPAQAMYHFLSGYTAKTAGTEKGVVGTVATFSTCFGAPFMVHHPTVYAKLLGERIARHDVACWLVNTGWIGGPPGTGTRMKLAYTRAMVNAAIEGRLADVTFVPEANFGLAIPAAVPDVPSELLDPRAAWADAAAYDAQAKKLAGLFFENFKRFADQASPDVLAVAITP